VRLRRLLGHQGRVAACWELQGADSLLQWSNFPRLLSIFEELSRRVELKVLHGILHQRSVLEGGRLDAAIDLGADRLIERVTLGANLLVFVVPGRGHELAELAWPLARRRCALRR